MIDYLKSLLTWDSRKFRAALLASAVAGVASYFGFTADQVWVTIAPLLAFIGAQGIADMAQGKKKAALSETPGNELLPPS